MLKFLRKYSKWILVVGGSLLMIAWLVPTGVQKMSQGRADPVFMTVDGQDVRQSAIGRAAYELEVLKQFGVQPTAEPEHWYLLTRQAEEAGYMGGLADAQLIVDQLAIDMANQMILQKYAQYGQIAQYMLGGQEWQTEHARLSEQMPQFISMLAARTRGNEDAIRMILARLAGVGRMQTAYTQAPRYSDRRLVSQARDLMDSAKLDYLFIPADAYTGEVTDPDEPTLLAFYERFKDVPAADAVVEDAEKTPPGGEYGIGYLLPARVKVVYLTLNRQAISQAVQPGELAVQKRFLDRFPGGVIPETLQQTAEQVKSDIREEVRAELTEKAMKTAQDAMRAEFAKATGKLASEGDYKKLPEDWAEHRPDFAAAARAVSQRLREIEGIVVPTPEVGQPASWQTVRGLSGLPGIGQAFYAQAGRRMPFSLLAMKVREIAGPNEAHVQVGVPAVDVLTDQAGNRYFYMVTEAREQSSPASMDEIREQVVTDFKRLTAYERLSTQIEALRQSASNQGLDVLLSEQQARLDGGDPVRTSLRISETSLGRSGPGGQADPRIDSEDFRRAVMAKAESLDPTKPAEETPAEERTIATPIDRSLGVVVGVVKAFVPVTKENYLSRQQQLVAGLNSRSAQEAKTENPFTLENLVKRMNVEFAGPRDEAGDEKKS